MVGDLQSFNVYVSCVGTEDRSLICNDILMEIITWKQEFPLRGCIRSTAKLQEQAVKGQGHSVTQRVQKVARGCGGAGASRTRQHLLGGGKLAKIVKKIHVKFQILSFICLRVK